MAPERSTPGDRAARRGGRVDGAAAALALLLSAAAPVHALPREARVPGGIALVQISDPGAPSAEPAPRVSFRERNVLVAPGAQGWIAVVGLPLDTAPGRHPLQVEHADGRTTEHVIEVAAKLYAEQRIRLRDARMVTPSQAEQERIEGELREQAEAKARWEPRAQVDLDFAAPAAGALSSRFGLRRLFNGLPRNPHSGLDFALPRGSAVTSAAAGTVALIGDYFFNGRTVFVDHGRGLLTMYCHLERIDVAVGEAVARGTPIGRSGDSGRATGPHLHWSVYLNATAVDPELFLDGGNETLKP
jgi:murein DD-endopeptidase MepM/ murein hydrolase activator NlpD